MPATRRLMPVLTTVVIAAVILAAGVGLLVPDVYRDPVSGTGIFSREHWRGSDLVTLLLVVPVSVRAYLAAGAGSWRGRLVWLGTIHFFVYNYSFYLFAGVLNWLFPLYLAIVGLAATLVVRAITSRHVPTVRFAAGRCPAWIASYMVLFIVAMTSIWTNQWIHAVGSGTSANAEGEFIRTVAAIDVLLLASGLLLGATGLWQSRSYGRGVAAILNVSATAEMLVLVAAAVLNARAGVDKASGEIPIWSMLCIGCLAASVASVRPALASASQSAG